MPRSPDRERPQPTPSQTVCENTLSYPPHHRTSLIARCSLCSTLAVGKPNRGWSLKSLEDDATPLALWPLDLVRPLALGVLGPGSSRWRSCRDGRGSGTKYLRLGTSGSPGIR